MTLSLETGGAMWAMRAESITAKQREYAGQQLVAVPDAGRRPPGAPAPRLPVSPGTRIIPISGVLLKDWTPEVEQAGDTSLTELARSIRAAHAAPDVRAVVLYVDSVGGAMPGVAEAAQAVAHLSAVKPVYAFSDGNLLGAAYWIASAARKVYISGPMVNVGGIDIVATHTEVSRPGVKHTLISAGDWRGMPAQGHELTGKGFKALQDRVHYMHSLFVTDVAKHRKLDRAALLAGAGDGRVYIGQQAIKTGLVDAIVGPLETFLGRLAAQTAGAPPSPQSTTAPTGQARASGASTHTMFRKTP
ncbi:MAG: S49 family peptidase [Burkholderiales bacterium]|nr:S49 family peptidase [Burkholderiales bacterium]